MFGVHFEAMVSKTQTNQERPHFRVILWPGGLFNDMSLNVNSVGSVNSHTKMVLATAQTHPNLAKEDN